MKTDNPHKDSFEELKGKKFRRISKYGVSHDTSIVKTVFYISEINHLTGGVKIKTMVQSENNNVYSLDEISFTDNNYFGFTELSEKQTENLMKRIEDHEKMKRQNFERAQESLKQNKINRLRKNFFNERSLTSGDIYREEPIIERYKLKSTLSAAIDKMDVHQIGDRSLVDPKGINEIIEYLEKYKK